ncbi:MAG: hypothetical protein U0517_03100 [Candidatus Andersenbacteria bacterium]
MFKKHTVFIHPSLRKMLEDRGYAYEMRLALHAALSFTTLLVSEHLRREYQGPWEVHEAHFKKLLGLGWKYADGLHAESNDLTGALEKAYRIESTIRRYMMDKMLRVDMRFYCRGEKESFWEIDFEVNQEGQLVGFGSGSLFRKKVAG